MGGLGVLCRTSCDARFGNPFYFGVWVLVHNHYTVLAKEPFVYLECQELQESRNRRGSFLKYMDLSRDGFRRLGSILGVY